MGFDNFESLIVAIRGNGLKENWPYNINQLKIVNYTTYMKMC